MKISLPIMQCDDNCGQCCGIVICKEHEYQKVVKYAADHGITPKSQGSTCPFYQQGRCQVYEVRPFVCQLFGHSPKLTCCKGYNVNIPAITERRLTRKYGKPDRFLHETLGDDWTKPLFAGLAEEFKASRAASAASGTSHSNTDM